MEITKVGVKKILTKKLEETNSIDKAASTEKTCSIKNLEENSIEVSPEAALHCDALEMVRNAPELRAEKVAALKAKIQAGEYQIDASKIAEQMLETHLENDLL